MSLRKTLSSFKNLISSSSALDKNDQDHTNISDIDDDDLVENEGK
jgi:hypothetical protein